MGGAETAAAWERSIKMAVLKGLKPEKVFAYFEKLCSVPHGSGNTKIISDLCVSFAEVPAGAVQQRGDLEAGISRP